LVNSSSFVFPVLFATFLFLAYVMLYTLTHLPKPPEPALDPGSPEWGTA